MHTSAMLHQNRHSIVSGEQQAHASELG